MYGWIAREDDYHLNNILGDNLRKRGQLKTISERQAEEEWKAAKPLFKYDQNIGNEGEAIERVACQVQRD